MVEVFWILWSAIHAIVAVKGSYGMMMVGCSSNLGLVALMLAGAVGWLIWPACWIFCAVI